VAQSIEGGDAVASGTAIAELAGAGAVSVVTAALAEAVGANSAAVAESLAEAFA